MSDLFLDEKQLTQLQAPINPKRVSKDPRGNHHLESYEVQARLTFIFGYMGWDMDVDYELVFEQSRQDGGRWDVAYRAKCRLTILGMVHREDVAVGSSQNQPNRADAHDLALKSASSGALKRAAKSLGNQFGLSLYSKDAPFDSVVGKTLAPAKHLIEAVAGAPDEDDPTRPF